VNLKGAFTPEDIDERLEKARKNFREEAKEATKKSERKRLFKKAKAIETLQDRAFAEATILEASRNRYGIVNLTLHYGRKKAEEMKLAFERARIRRGLRK
jgi:hypothetical protein